MVYQKPTKLWFITGSQHLYGEETLNQVSSNSQKIVEGLSASSFIVPEVVLKPVLTNRNSITKLCMEANADPECAGCIAWMHTFSPAKMWITGLQSLVKPLVHLHTQFNRDIPWSDIDMDFMNLNQSAHGGREFGFIGSRLRLSRKIVVGHWQENEVLEELDTWARAATAWHDMRTGRIARFGDNMRDVAVTEGDKVESQMRFGYSVDGFGVGDLVECVNNAPESDISALIGDYESTYFLADELKKGGEKRSSLKEAAQIEAGMRLFLKEGGFTGFTTTFENLHGLGQLPGLAVQRLMVDGYGFGGEGDWKTAALVRAMKVMGQGLDGGTSFMEDYTYHFNPGGMKVLGAHMLEVCASIAKEKPRLDIYPLSIGDRADPVRLIFDVSPGPALNASIVDMGKRFRLIVNTVEVVAPDEPLPKLPVARVLWKPKPNLKTAAAAWILAGGAHHSGFSQCLSAEHLEDFSDMANIEYLLINDGTKISDFKNALRWNDLYYHLAQGL